MDKEKILQLVSLAFEIQSERQGTEGFPYISINIGNHGTNVMVWIMDDGFEDGTKYSGEYDFMFGDKSCEKNFKKCMNHLERLRERVMELGK